MRVNRGPLALRKLSRGEVAAVYKSIARFGSRWRGAALSIAPELEPTGEHYTLLGSMGFRRRIVKPHESIWIDLEHSLDQLREEMKGSWRKAIKDLDAPDRKGIDIQLSMEAEAVEWMLQRHENHMRERQFAGAQASLVRALGRNRGSLLVFRAFKDGNAVAGVCIALHGAAATYLIGWSDEIGRKHAASQMLLWSAVKALKDRKLMAFDMGGIDDKHTPGISAFKRGLGGTEYQLAGEYWRA